MANTPKPEQGTSQSTRSKQPTHSARSSLASRASTESVEIPEEGTVSEEAEIRELISSALGKSQVKEEVKAEATVSNSESEEDENGGEQIEMDLGIGSDFKVETDGEEPIETVLESKESGSNKSEERTGFVRSIFDFVELFVFTLLAVMLVTTFLFRHSEVDGDSMDNTLHHGDHLIISNLFYKPDYGDIIVFSSERNDGTVLVKRIVALEGDEVDCIFAEGQYLLYVNNVLVDEPYKCLEGGGDVLTEVTDYIVGEGEVFVLGDHRNASSDSATFPHTTIKVESILGKVLIRIYPFESFGTVE